MGEQSRIGQLASGIALTLFGVMLGAFLTDDLVKLKNVFVDAVWSCDVNSIAGFDALAAGEFDEAARHFQRAEVCTTPVGLRSAAQLAELYCARVIRVGDPQQAASKLLRRASDNAGAAMYDIQVAVQRCEASGWGREDYFSN